ncbi:MAG: hypothetical protein RLZZ252_1149 [Bacteroidota bacterium]|jgi:hypothetical protein
MKQWILTITLITFLNNDVLIANASIAPQNFTTKIQQIAGLNEPQIDLVSLRKSPKITPVKRHSITPMLSLSNTSTSNFILQVSPTLLCEFSSGETLNTPLAVRYQYRMKQGNRLGFDYLNMYSSFAFAPKAKDNSLGFYGPMVPAFSSNLHGFNVHYSKAIDIKLLEIFGFVGAGGYLTGKPNTTTADYSWYRNASAEFYDFAPAVTHNVIKSFIPMLNFGAGVRLKHLEGGINNQFSLSSPIKAIQYQGNTFQNNIRLKSIGYYIAYRWEF